MFGLALATVRLRKGAAVASFVALFGAALIVCACGVLLETGLHGAIPAERYAGAPVVVAADQQIHWTEVKTKEKKGEVKTKTKVKSKVLAARAWLPASVGDRLADLPEATVVEDLIFPANVVRSSGSVLSGEEGRPTRGHGWSSARLTPYVLISGTSPRGPNDVVLDTGLADAAGLRVGEQTTIQSTSVPKTYRVSGLVRPAAGVGQESALFFGTAEARRLAGHAGSVAAYGVFGADAQQVRDAVAGTGAQVATGNDRGRLEFVDAASARVKLTSMGGALAGTALIVAVLVVVGTFTLAIAQRYRELALLRAVGATPRQIRRMISSEALVLGVAAAIPGALLGVPLADAIRPEFVSLGAISGVLELARSPFPVLAAMVATVGGALIAARVTARRTARIRPVEALAEAAVERETLGARRALVGLVFTGVATLITVVLTALHTEAAAMPVTYLTILAWMIALTLLGPYLARGALALLSVPMRLFPVGGFLAAHNSRANSRRVASVITPLALLVGMSMTILFVPGTTGDAARAQAVEGTKADHLIVSTGQGVPAAAVEALRATPGVSAAIAVLSTTIWAGQDKRSAQSFTSSGLTQALDPGVTSGSLAQLAPGTIAMSDQAAGNRRLGATVPVTLGDGVRTKLRLVATYSRHLGFGDTLLSYADVVGHVDDPLAGSVLIKATLSAQQIQARIKNYPGLLVTDRSSLDKVRAERQQTNAEVNLVFMGLIIAFTAIAVINTLAMTIGDRIREFALMRLVGSTRRQVLEMLRWELAVIVLIGASFGTITALATLTGFSVGIIGSVAPGITGGTYVVILAGALALGLVATIIPAHFVLRRDPAEDINAR